MANRDVPIGFEVNRSEINVTMTFNVKQLFKSIIGECLGLGSLNIIGRFILPDFQLYHAIVSPS